MEEGKVVHADAAPTPPKAVQQLDLEETHDLQPYDQEEHWVGGRLFLFQMITAGKRQRLADKATNRRGVLNSEQFVRSLCAEVIVAELDLQTKTPLPREGRALVFDPDQESSAIGAEMEEKLTSFLGY